MPGTLVAEEENGFNHVHVKKKIETEKKLNFLCSLVSLNFGDIESHVESELNLTQKVRSFFAITFSIVLLFFICPTLAGTAQR